MNATGAPRGPPPPPFLPVLRRTLSEKGYAYCHLQNEIISKTVNPASPTQGLYTLRYRACPQCGPEATPPYQPFTLNRLDTSTAIDIPQATQNRQPHPPIPTRSTNCNSKPRGHTSYRRPKSHASPDRTCTPTKPCCYPGTGVPTPPAAPSSRIFENSNLDLTSISKPTSN